MISNLRRLLRVGRLFWHMLLSLLVVYPLLSVLQRFGRREVIDYQQAIARWWSRKFCRIVNVRIQTHGKINTHPTLFVANHISWIDIICLRALLNATFVAKQEVRDWPVFGGLAARIGTLFFKRGEEGQEVAGQMTELLARGRSVLFFPEGTSSCGDGVLHFHARLFQAAVRTTAEVQAVAVIYPHPQRGMNPVAPFVGEQLLLENLWRVLGEPKIEVQLNFCPALVSAGAERRSLAEHSRAQILSLVSAAQAPDRVPDDAPDDAVFETGAVEAVYSPPG